MNLKKILSLLLILILSTTLLAGCNSGEVNKEMGKDNAEEEPQEKKVLK